MFRALATFIENIRRGAAARAKEIGIYMRTREVAEGHYDVMSVDQRTKSFVVLKVGDPSTHTQRLRPTYAKDVVRILQAMGARTTHVRLRVMWEGDDNGSDWDRNRSTDSGPSTSPSPTHSSSDPDHHRNPSPPEAQGGSFSGGGASGSWDDRGASNRSDGSSAMAGAAVGAAVGIGIAEAASQDQQAADALRDLGFSDGSPVSDGSNADVVADAGNDSESGNDRAAGSDSDSGGDSGSDGSDGYGR